MIKPNTWEIELMRRIQTGTATANYETGEVFFLCGIDNETEVYVGTLRRKLLPFRKKWINQKREIERLVKQRIAKEEEKKKWLEELVGNGRDFRLNTQDRNSFIEDITGLYIGSPYSVNLGFGLYSGEGLKGSTNFQGILDEVNVHVETKRYHVSDMKLLNGFRIINDNPELFERRVIDNNPGNDWRFPAILCFQRLSEEDFKRDYQKVLDQLNTYQI